MCPDGHMHPGQAAAQILPPALFWSSFSSLGVTRFRVVNFLVSWCNACEMYMGSNTPQQMSDWRSLWYFDTTTGCYGAHGEHDLFLFYMTNERLVVSMIFWYNDRMLWSTRRILFVSILYEIAASSLCPLQTCFIGHCTFNYLSLRMLDVALVESG